MYCSLAPFYEQTHAGFSDDLPLLLDLAARFGDPLLELGCGAGRLLLPLARAGRRVTGLDLEPAMLANARRNLAGEPDPVRSRVHLVCADMRRFTAAARVFRLAFASHNTFMHLRPAEMRLALRWVRRSLQPTGGLFIDLANAAVVVQTPGDNLLSLEHCLTLPESGEQLLVMAHNRLEEAEQALHTTWIYDVSTPGSAVSRTVFAVTYHYLFPHQLELLLRESGFVLESLLGDYDGSIYGESSPRMLALAVPRD